MGKCILTAIRIGERVVSQEPNLCELLSAKRKFKLISFFPHPLLPDFSPSSTSMEPPAYFLALLSTLDQLVRDTNLFKTNSERRELLARHLLSTISPHLDPTTLRSRLSSTLATITPLYQSFEHQAPALESLIQISQCSLSAAPQLSLEKDLQGARSCYAATSSLCADTRPKVRRRAQEAVQHVLKNPPPGNSTPLRI